MWIILVTLDMNHEEFTIDKENPMTLPQRKPNRLRAFDYSSPGAYFITICTDERRNLFWADVGASIARPQDVCLSGHGRIVDAAIHEIPVHYPAVSVEHYVIMPNHAHLLLQLHTDACGRAMPAPTISTVVQQFKGAVSKQAGISVWQKSFHDHVVRDEKDFLEIREYIETNPMKWTQDRFYAPE